jgi:opacity protein-like surface antigen
MMLRLVMHLWLLLAMLLFGTFVVHELHAQALTTASGGGSYLAVGGTLTATHVPYGDSTGFGGVAYVDSNMSPRVGLEYEGRFLRYNLDEDVSLSSYLAGARVVFWRGRTQPYVKVMAGLGRMTFPFHYATGSYFVIAPGAGLDYALSNRWTVRILDVEYQDWTGFTYGSMQPYSVSSGLRFRLNGIELFPKKMRHRH